MTVMSVDIGFVSATDALVAFYRDVFDLEALEPRVFPDGTVHRLALGAGALKVMVPAKSPADSPRTERFLDQAGLRYVTMWLDDLDAVIERWTVHGGTVALVRSASARVSALHYWSTPTATPSRRCTTRQWSDSGTYQETAARPDPPVSYTEDGVDHDADDQDHDHVRDEQRVVAQCARVVEADTQCRLVPDSDQ